MIQSSSQLFADAACGENNAEEVDVNSLTDVNDV